MFLLILLLIEKTEYYQPLLIADQLSTSAMDILEFLVLKVLQSIPKTLFLKVVQFVVLVLLIIVEPFNPSTNNPNCVLSTHPEILPKPLNHSTLYIFLSIIKLLFPELQQSLGLFFFLSSPQLDHILLRNLIQPFNCLLYSMLCPFLLI